MDSDCVLVTCPSCGLSKSVPSRNFPQNSVRVSCPKCSSFFLFDKHKELTDNHAETTDKPNPTAINEKIPPESSTNANLSAPLKCSEPVDGNVKTKVFRRVPPKEYGMTFVVRILTAITLFPLGLLLTSASFDSKGSPDYAILFFGVSLIIGTVMIWVYHFTKKILFLENSIEVRSIFGSTKVTMNDRTSIAGSTKQADTSVPAGMYFGAIGGLAAGLMQGAAKDWSEEKVSHINIAISNGKSRIKLNSNVKGVHEIRDRLADFEVNFILPSLAAQYGKGKSIAFGPISMQNGKMIAHGKSIPVSDIDGFELKDGCLIVSQRKAKRPFVKTKTTEIQNMNTLFALLRSTH